MELTRRGFLQGAACGIAGTALVGIAGCAPQGESNGPNQGAPASEAGSTAPEEKNVSQTLDCDVCVVGAGFSGMIAAIQAHEDGAHVIVLESAGKTGGASANGVEGSFGVNSSISKQLGIEVDIKGILMSEMQQSQWRADGLSWLEMMERSGENIDWLAEQGVRFGTVDDYHGKDYRTFHWYEGGITEGYINPMTAKMEELGMQVEFSTKAEELMLQDGEVHGVYAKNKSDEWIQVNAKAVILATGGFGANYELCSKIGYPADRLLSVGSPNDDGSGHAMAVAAGAKDIADYAADNCGSIIKSFSFSMTNLEFCMAPQIPWINESCERFYKEDNCVVNLSLANPPKWNQARSFMLWDEAIFNDYAANQKDDMHAMLDSALSSGEGDVLKADTLAELAQAADLDPHKLESFVQEYNAMCAAGKDELWGKDPQYLVPLQSPPYYLAQPINAMFTTIGGVATNRNAQAIDAEHYAIEGLYVVGVEGCMLYRNVYTIGTPGSCSGNSINTARTAAKHAVANRL